MSTAVKVLLADSDERLLEVYSHRLEEEGFDVKTAKNGLDCVDRLREFDPDFLVLEPQLPWGQGEGVLSFMREEADVPLVPVIVVSGTDERLDRYKLPAFPVLERLSKPLPPDMLADNVRRLAEMTSVR